MATAPLNSNDQSPSLGELLIAELGNRGLRGQYFDYAAYQELKNISTAEEMQSFLDRCGYASVHAKADPCWVADGLEEEMEDRSPPRAIELFEPLALLLYPIWLLGRLRKKRRVFPSQRKRLARKIRLQSSSTRQGH